MIQAPNGALNLECHHRCSQTSSRHPLRGQESAMLELSCIRIGYRITSPLKESLNLNPTFDFQASLADIPTYVLTILVGQRLLSRNDASQRRCRRQASARGPS